jgi:hypothetical protein
MDFKVGRFFHLNIGNTGVEQVTYLEEQCNTLALISMIVFKEKQD